MADYSDFTWIDDDGSLTVGTPLSAARMNNIEAGLKDAAQDSKQRGAIGSRPAASSATKNWFWVDEANGQMSYCDGSAWHDVGGSPVDTAKPRTVNWVAITDVDIDNPNVEDFDTKGSNGSFATISNGDRLMLGDSGNVFAGDAGIYTWNGRGVPLTRADDFEVAAGAIIFPEDGIWFGGQAYIFTPGSYAFGLRSDGLHLGAFVRELNMAANSSETLTIPVPIRSFYLVTATLYGGAASWTHGALITKATLVSVPGKTVNPKFSDLLVGDLRTAGSIDLETTDGGAEFAEKAGGASADYEFDVRITTPATRGIYRYFVGVTMLPWGSPGYLATNTDNV